MAWKGIITNVGSALLAARGEADTLKILGAAAGAGRVDEMTLMAQTELKDRRADMSIASKTAAAEGIRLKLQLTPGAESFKMGQLGIYAQLNSGPRTLLAIFQNDADVDIPSVEDSPDFSATFFAMLTFSNQGVLEVTVDANALVTHGSMEEYVAAELAGYTDTEALNAALAEKANTADMTAALAGKADLVGGQVPAGQIPALSYDPAGSAAAVQASLNAHVQTVSGNPHRVTAAEVGADPAGSAAAVSAALAAHTGNVTGNPHRVTAAQVGARPRLALGGAVDFNTILQDGHYEYLGVSANTPYGNAECHFHLMVFHHTDVYVRQVAYDVRTNAIFTRALLNGAWTGWGYIYTDHNKPAPATLGAPTVDGVGATGTWPINITGSAASAGTAGTCTGNAATATNATNHINNRQNPHGVTPSQIGAAAANHTHDVSQVTGAVRVQTGSYTGTGTYGSSNPCRITFLFSWIFPPRIISFK